MGDLYGGGRTGDGTGHGSMTGTYWINPNGKGLPLELALYRFWALSKCQFGDTVGEAMWRTFLCTACCPVRISLQPSNGHWAGLGPKIPLPSGPHQYSAHPGESHPSLHPKEEAWLDLHLDELMAKGMIGPILPGEQLHGVLCHCC